MNHTPSYREKRAEERKEREKQLEKRISRNWIICIGALAVIIAAIFFSR